MRFFLCLSLCLIAFQSLIAQRAANPNQDSSRVTSRSIDSLHQTAQNDSSFRFMTRYPSPKRAGMYSALVPGLGQIYNRQYWKAGLVYAAAAVSAGFLISNQRNYRKYHKAYIYRIDNNPDTPILYPEYTTEDLNLLRKGFRQYTEYSAIAGTLIYLMNILDAYISAHLKTFDMSKDISLRPSSTYQNGQTHVGISLHF